MRTSSVIPFTRTAGISPMQLGQGIAHWLKRMEARGKALNTLIAYQNDLRQYEAWIERAGQSDLVAVQSPVMVSRFLDDQDALGVAKRTQARRLSALRMFFRHAQRESWIGHDPTADEAVSFERPLKIAPEMDDLHQVIRAIPDDGVANVRDRAMLRLMLDTGLRITPLCQLDAPGMGTPTAVDMARKLVHYIGKGGKPSTKPFNDVTAGYIEAWLAVRSDEARRGIPALFVNRRGVRLSRGTAHHNIKSRGEAVGLKLHAHLIRHRRGADVIETCGDKVAQQFLDHTSLTTTSQYGQHANNVTMGMLRERADIDRPRSYA